MNTSAKNFGLGRTFGDGECWNAELAYRAPPTPLKVRGWEGEVGAEAEDANWEKRNGVVG